MANLKNTNIDDNLELPQGTTAQRPASPEEGQIRYNTDLETVEFYNGENWRPLSDTHPEATGGTVVDTDIGGVPYRIHYFTETGTDTLTVTNPGEVEYLIVAGGGAGGLVRGGGGGAGGILTGSTLVSPQNYTITVGNGADGGKRNTGTSSQDNAGDSSAFGLTALGGGVGGRKDEGSEPPSDGGSGGGEGGAGGAGQGVGIGLQPGSSSGGFGNNGGTGVSVGSTYSGGGGGGAGSNGRDGVNRRGGDGGTGIASLITGNTNFYAGGGGGHSDTGNPPGKGGLGGGGTSGIGNDAVLGNAQDGTPNTGGGGGGGGYNSGNKGGNGGSGIVIVRYPRNSSLDTEPDETRPSYQPYFYARDVRPIIARTGLVLELDAANPLSYPGTGDTWRDLSGNGNDGTLVNGVGYTSQNFGSLTFDGVDNYVGNIGSSITENDFPNGTFTLSAWFFWQGNESGGGSDGRNYVLQNSGTNNFPLSLEVNSRNYDPPRFSTWEHTTSGSSHLNSSTSVNENRWYNFVVVRNDTDVLMYVDGEEIYQNTRRSGDLLSFQGFNVGTHRNANNRWFYGKIPFVQVYTRALSESEIKQNFNATRGRYGI